MKHQHHLLIYVPLLALTVFCLGTSVARAHLGETPEECVNRYGKATATDAKEDSMTFVKDGINVRCLFFEGKCFQVEYRSAQMDPATPRKPVPLAEAQIKQLKTANGLDPANPLKDVIHHRWTANYLAEFRVLFVTDVNAEVRKDKAEAVKRRAAAEG